MCTQMLKNLINALDQDANVAREARLSEALVRPQAALLKLIRQNFLVASLAVLIV